VSAKGRSVKDEALRARRAVLDLATWLKSDSKSRDRHSATADHVKAQVIAVQQGHAHQRAAISGHNRDRPQLPVPHHLCLVCRGDEGGAVGQGCDLLMEVRERQMLD